MTFLVKMSSINIPDAETMGTLLEWLSGIFTPETVLVILFMAALIWVKHNDHNTHIDVLKDSINEKKQELKNVTEDRNYYRNKVLGKELPSSNDIGNVDIDDTNKKEEK